MQSKERGRRRGRRFFFFSSPHSFSFSPLCWKEGLIIFWVFGRLRLTPASATVCGVLAMFSPNAATISGSAKASTPARFSASLKHALKPADSAAVFTSL